jgi:hypothetical protein
MNDLTTQIRARDARVQLGMERMHAAIRAFGQRVEREPVHITLAVAMQWPEFRELVASEREWGR